VFQRKNKQDARFTIAHREAWIGVGIAVFNFIWWYGFAYGFGSKPISQYHYIWGFPAWFFYSCIIGFIIVTGLVIVIVLFIFKDIPLGDTKERDEE